MKLDFSFLILSRESEKDKQIKMLVVICCLEEEFSTTCRLITKFMNYMCCKNFNYLNYVLVDKINFILAYTLRIVNLNCIVWAGELS